MSEAAIPAARQPAHLKHHFETSPQQFEAGKLGMWLFLATELLMFGGLFCAYAIYRGIHPEIFAYGHGFLDVKWGAINTLVLIFSSLTMAWAVRSAQLGQRRMLVAMLAITLACAAAFLGIKYVEYSHKFDHGLMWGTSYRPDAHLEGAHGEANTPEASVIEPAEGHADTGAASSRSWNAPETSVIGPAAAAPPGLASTGRDPAASGKPEQAVASPANAHIFFGLYFAMTGLHGIHVLAGMIVISILLVGALRGAFGPEYFTPVDLVGLYWHVVDLVWIFLFPLLYLVS